MSEKSTKSAKRTRNWTIVVYPHVSETDGAPVNWREILDEEHIAWVESPLHEYDVNPDGEVKKAHWHILLLFEGVKTYDQVKQITDKIRSPHPQICNSARGMVRYMVHMDNPEKVQYDVSEIVCHGGADIADYLQATVSERYKMIDEMIAYIDDNVVTEFADFMDFVRRERRSDWFPLLCDNSTYVIDKHIKSRRHQLKERRLEQ